MPMQSSFDFCQIDLDRRCHAYVRAQLTSGHVMSKRIEDALIMESFRWTTFLPADVSSDSVYDFENGGKIKRGPGIPYEQSLAIAEDWLAGRIFEQLAADQHRSCVVEEQIATMMESEGLKSNKVFFGGHFGFFVGNGAGREEVELALNEGKTWMRNGFVFDADWLAGRTQSATLDAQMIEDLRCNVSAVFVDAYRGDEYIRK